MKLRHKIFIGIEAVAMLIFFAVGFTKGFGFWWHLFNEICLYGMLASSFRAAVPLLDNGWHTMVFDLVATPTFLLVTMVIGLMELRVLFDPLLRRIFAQAPRADHGDATHRDATRGNKVKYFFLGNGYKKIFWGFATAMTLIFLFVVITQGWYGLYAGLNDLLVALLVKESFRATLMQVDGHYPIVFGLIRSSALLIFFFVYVIVMLRIFFPAIVRRILWGNNLQNGKVKQ